MSKSKSLQINEIQFIIFLFKVVIVNDYFEKTDYAYLHLQVNACLHYIFAYIMHSLQYTEAYFCTFMSQIQDRRNRHLLTTQSDYKTYYHFNLKTMYVNDYFEKPDSELDLIDLQTFALGQYKNDKQFV